MNRRHFFFSSAAAAFAFKSALGASESISDQTEAISPLGVKATHDALFQFWFPLQELKIPPAEKSELEKIASGVRYEIMKQQNVRP